MENIVEISYKEAVDFLLPKHYSGRKPQITKSFGLFIDDDLMAVCTFGKPASPSLCKGIMGGKYSDNVYELNRLCRKDNYNGQLSHFVSCCLRQLENIHVIIKTMNKENIVLFGVRNIVMFIFVQIIRN